MFKKNRLLAMLDEKKIPLGIQMFSGCSSLIEVLGQTGFDFVMIDTEHCAINVRALEELVRTAELAGVIPYVRVPDLHNEVEIRRALEAGAEGLFLPLVKSVEDIERVASFAFIPPKGTRGICPAVRAAKYSFGMFGEYVAWNNSEIALVPMIENADGVENVDSICAHPDVKMIVFAPGDLSYQLGEGTHGMKSPKIRAAFQKVMDAAKRHDVAVIGGPILNPTPETCKKSFEDGIRIFCLGLDILGFRRFCEQTVSSLNAGIKQTDWTREPAPPSGFMD